MCGCRETREASMYNWCEVCKRIQMFENGKCVKCKEDEEEERQKVNDFLEDLRNAGSEVSEDEDGDN